MQATVSMSAWRRRWFGMLSNARLVLRHWADPQSRYRKIATSFVWISVFVLIGRLASAGKEVTIAWRYGVSETLDAYLFVFNLLNMPVSVWFSVLTVVLVPLVIRMKTEAPDDLPQFRAEMLGLTLALGGGLSLLALLGLPMILRADWSRLSGNTLVEALKFSEGMALLTLFSSLVSLFSVWLFAAGRHKNTAFEVIPAATLSLALLLPTDYLTTPLVWGTVLGAALHMGALLAPLRKHEKLPYPSLRLRSPAWRRLWGGMGIMVVNQVLMSFLGLVDQFVAAGLGVGALSILNYANRVLGFILTLLAITIGRAMLPVFSQPDAISGVNANALVLRCANWMFVMGVGGGIICWIAAPLAIEILLQRGAFTQDDSREVTLLLRWSLIQIPFYVYCATIVNYIASQYKYSIILISSCIAVFVKLSAIALLASSLNLVSLVLSSVAIHCASSIYFYFKIKPIKKLI